MKKIVLLFVSAIAAATSYAQTPPVCDSAYIANEKNPKKAEPCVLTAAEYVLSRPLHGNPRQYFDDRAFILLWMDKTSDFTFSLNEKMMNVCKEGDNVLLFGVYTTCLAKAAIDKRKNFTPEAIRLFTEYIKNPDNKVEQTATVKALIEAQAAGKIDKYLK